MTGSRLHLGIIAAAAGLALTTGCAPRGVLQFVSLNPNAIDPPNPTVWKYPIQHAYWWIDKEGRISISFAHRHGNLLLGKLGDFQMELSLVPGPPPNGRARDYKIEDDSFRMRCTQWISQEDAYRAAFGVLAVYMDSARRIHGSFRIWLLPPDAPAWDLAPRERATLLCFARFQAVHDERRGAAIRTRTERDGWERPPRPLPPPTSMPAIPTTIPDRPIRRPERRN